MTPLSDPLQRSRPRGLLLTSVLCIMVGWAGVWSGYREVSFYSAEYVEDPPMAANIDAREQEALQTYFRAERQIRDRARPVRLPLAIGNMLLSGLLVLAASRTFGGRPGSRALAQQALGANALLAVADYALSRDMRNELAPAVAQVTRVMLKPGASQVPEAELMSSLTSMVWTGIRLQLLLALVLYAATWFVLSTDAARAYLIDEPQEDEPEDE